MKIIINTENMYQRRGRAYYPAGCDFGDGEEILSHIFVQHDINHATIRYSRDFLLVPDKPVKPGFWSRLGAFFNGPTEIY